MVIVTVPFFSFFVRRPSFVHNPTSNCVHTKGPTLGDVGGGRGSARNCASGRQIMRSCEGDSVRGGGGCARDVGEASHPATRLCTERGWCFLSYACRDNQDPPNLSGRRNRTQACAPPQAGLCCDKEPVQLGGAPTQPAAGGWSSCLVSAKLNAAGWVRT